MHFAEVMSSLKETRDLLLVSCVKGIINANEFAILYDVNMSKNPLFPYDNYEQFSLDNFSEEECIAEFRVEKNDLPVLADALGIPPVFRCSQRSVFRGTQRICSSQYLFCRENFAGWELRFRLFWEVKS